MKRFQDIVNDIRKSTLTPAKKEAALVKMGITKYEAHVLASMPYKEPYVFHFTFGVEMETVHCPASSFMSAAGAQGISAVNNLSHYNHHDIPQFKLVPDSSIYGSNPAECVTPALDGNESGYDLLKRCCKALAQVGATVNSSCGLHVHIGAGDLSEKEYCNVFFNYQRIEKAIDSFMAESRRANNSHWCATLKNHDLSHCTTRNHVYHELSGDRYHKVNPCAYDRHKTIEFRQHQGTVNFAKIKAWVGFLGKLVEYSKEHRIAGDIDRIEDIPFLTQDEKAFFIGRREQLNN